MKAERRHQLQENALARGLVHSPDFFRRYGSHLMLAVIAVLLLVVVVRWRWRGAQESAVTAASALSQARSLIEQIPTAPILVGQTRTESLSSFVGSLTDNAQRQIDLALEASDDVRVTSEAHLLQGDLNWALAALPEVPGSQSRPALALEKSDEQYLNAALDAYQKVLEAGRPPEVAAAARLGLAAIAENRGDWNGARSHYQSLIDAADAPGPFKDQAQSRIEELAKIRQAPLIATTTTADEESGAGEETGTAAEGPPKPATPPGATAEPAKPEAPKPETPAAEQPKTEPAPAPAPAPEQKTAPGQPEPAKPEAPAAPPTPPAPPQAEGQPPTPAPQPTPPQPEAPKAEEK